MTDNTAPSALHGAAEVVQHVAEVVGQDVHDAGVAAWTAVVGDTAANVAHAETSDQVIKAVLDGLGLVPAIGSQVKSALLVAEDLLPVWHEVVKLLEDTTVGKTIKEDVQKLMHGSVISNKPPVVLLTNVQDTIDALNKGTF